MKRRLFNILLVGLIFYNNGAFYASEIDNSVYAGASKELHKTIQYCMILVPEVQKLEVEYVGQPYFDFSVEESYLLRKIAMAEAEGEGTFVKALVMKTIINRVESEEFPNSIESVIFQHKQFSPLEDGRWEQVEPNGECWEAFYYLLNSDYDFSNGALYFDGISSSGNWHDWHLQFLFQHGDMKFYK